MAHTGAGNVVLVGAGADEVQRPAVARARSVSSRATSISESAGGTPCERLCLQRRRDLIEQILDGLRADDREHARRRRRRCAE